MNELETKDLVFDVDKADEVLYNVFYNKFQELIKKYGAKKMSKVSDKHCSLMIHLNQFSPHFQGILVYA